MAQAYYMIDDVMECSAGLWLPHFEKFLKLLLQGAMDADPTTRQVLPAALCLAILTRRAVTFFFCLQAALYGIGAAAQNSPVTKFGTVLQPAISVLQRIISDPAGRSDMNEVCLRDCYWSCELLLLICYLIGCDADCHRQCSFRIGQNNRFAKSTAASRSVAQLHATAR